MGIFNPITRPEKNCTHKPNIPVRLLTTGDETLDVKAIPYNAIL